MIQIHNFNELSQYIDQISNKKYLIVDFDDTIVYNKYSFDRSGIDLLSFDNIGQLITISLSAREYFGKNYVTTDNNVIEIINKFSIAEWYVIICSYREKMDIVLILEVLGKLGIKYNDIICTESESKGRIVTDKYDNINTDNAIVIGIDDDLNALESYGECFNKFIGFQYMPHKK